jgi:4-hydroxybenzoate polyprenyltransferase
MRPQQWIKNLLLLAPLIMAHQIANLPKLLSCVVAIFAFCMCASSIYVINDLLDAEVDRHHPKKKYRPFASGQIPMAVGPPLALCLASVGLAVAVMWLPADFQLVLLCYLVLTTIYSLWLKSKAMIDVVLLSVLYTLRVVAGGMAAEVEVSEWMMSFSLFIFTSLAFAKRYSELVRLSGIADNDLNSGRGYHPNDLQMLGTMGPACGCLSVLVLALYLNSDQVKLLYANPSGLWLLCPLMLYWIGRLWIVAGRGDLPDDPVAYTASDRLSWVIALCAALLLLLAS